jgi:hypothetical protein
LFCRNVEEISAMNKQKELVVGDNISTYPMVQIPAAPTSIQPYLAKISIILGFTVFWTTLAGQHF